MPQYFSPGVYVEEVDSGPRPIQGVSTSVTGAVGVTQRGPTEGKPTLVTSFGEFVNVFGGFLDEPDATTKAELEDDGKWWLFAHAVRGFFDNGGQQLYVKRVVAHDATKAGTVVTQGLISELVGDAKENTQSLRVRHVIGRDTGTNKAVKLIDGATGLKIDDFVITAYTQGSTECTVSLDKPLVVKASAGRGDYLEFSSDPTQRLKIASRSKGSWGNDVQVTVRPMVGATLTLRKNEQITDGTASTTLASDSIPQESEATRPVALKKTTGFVNGDTVKINGQKYVLSGVGTTVRCQQTLTSKGTAGTFKLGLGGVDSADIAFNANAGAIETALNDVSTIEALGVTCTGGPINTTPVVIEFNDTLSLKGVALLSVKAVGLTGPISVAMTRSYGNATVPHVDGDRSIWTSGAEVRKLRKATGQSKAEIYLSGAGRLYQEAMVELDNGRTKAFARVTKVASDNVTLDPAPGEGFFEGDAVHVIEGEVLANFVSDGEVVTSEQFQNLKLKSNDIDDPLLITNQLNKRSQLIEVIADSAVSLSNSSLSDFPMANRVSCEDGDDNFSSLTVNDFIGENLGSGKRSGIQSFEDIEDISIVIVPGMWSETIITELITHCETMRYRVAIVDSRHGDTITQAQEYRSLFDSSRAALYHPWVKVRSPVTGDSVDAPPSGLIAGIYADVDTRRGVHKAPANEVIRSIIGLEQDITRREQDLLNPKGINALRFFPGRGFRVWGARTISSDSNFRYINVRRIFNFIERSIDEATQFVVFEPNDETLWARIRQTIGNFLNTQWRAGMLEGKTADEAFFVACDRGATMTQDDIENGRLICQVGIAPVFPAEFVIFRIQKFTADSKLG